MSTMIKPEGKTGPWGLNVDPVKLALRQSKMKGVTFGASPVWKPVDKHMKYTVIAEDQGYLNFCTAFMFSTQVGIMIREACGMEALPPGIVINPISVMMQGLKDEGIEGKNSGLSTCATIYRAAGELGFWDDTVKIIDVGFDQSSIDQALQLAPLGSPINCIKACFPGYVSTETGEIDEEEGPTVFEKINIAGHAVTMVATMQQGDLRNVLIANSWGSDYGYKGFFHMAQTKYAMLALEGPWLIKDWNPAVDRKWEKFIIDTDDLQKQVTELPKKLDS